MTKAASNSKQKRSQKASKGGEMSGAVMDTRPSPVEPEDGGGAAKRLGGGGGVAKSNQGRIKKQEKSQ